MNWVNLKRRKENNSKTDFKTDYYIQAKNYYEWPDLSWKWRVLGGTQFRNQTRPEWFYGRLKPTRRQRTATSTVKKEIILPGILYTKLPGSIHFYRFDLQVAHSGIHFDGHTIKAG